MRLSVHVYGHFEVITISMIVIICVRQTSEQTGLFRLYMNVKDKKKLKRRITRENYILAIWCCLSRGERKTREREREKSVITLAMYICCLEKIFRIHLKKASVQGEKTYSIKKNAIEIDIFEITFNLA